MTKNFVALDVCPYCNKDRAIVLQRNFVNGEPKHDMPDRVITSLEPCDECRRRMDEEDKFFLVKIEKDRVGYKELPIDAVVEEKQDEIRKHRVVILED